MNHIQPRIAIYSCPNPESEIYKKLCILQGYNPFTKTVLKPDSIIEPYIGPTGNFGPHITIHGVFSPTDYNGFIDTVHEIVKDIEPFSYTFFDCIGLDRSHLFTNVKLIPALVLSVDPESSKRFMTVHKKLRTATREFKKGVDPVWKTKIFRSDEKIWSHILEFGSPYAMKNYIPHLSIATAMTENEELWRKTRNYIKETYPMLFNNPISFDTLYIFEEIVEGDLKGNYYVKEAISL